jgi:glycosyltransferase involved in cell wall biosynthesis
MALDIRIDPGSIGTGVSVVFPVYNEATVIERTVKDYFAELEGRVPFEMIVAEDGSTDGTQEVLHELASTLAIRVSTHEERKGYLNAIKGALALAERDWIFLVDSDYQFAAIDFWRLVPKMSTHDIILGKKSPRMDPTYRILLSRGLNLLLRILFRVPYTDMDTGFRLMRREAVARLAPEVHHFAFFTAEFVVRCHKAGYRVAEVPVPHYSRKEGTTRIFYVSKLPLIVLRQLRGIWRLRRELREKHSAPEHLQAPSPDRTL